MTRDIEKYQAQIKKFVDELCYIYYKHSQPEDRADICHEVALIAHQKRDKIKDSNETEFLGWLRGITKNVIWNRSRREGKIAKRSSDNLDNVDVDKHFAQNIESSIPLPEAYVLSQERLQVIRTAISKLSLIHQQVIWSFYVEEQSEKEIAQRLGIQRGTVKSRLHNARKLLAVLLEPYIMDD